MVVARAPRRSAFGIPNDGKLGRNVIDIK